MPIPETSEPTLECPQPHLWNQYDVATAELEVLDFLTQLVRTIKPRLVVETGTYRGISACYIAKALKENGRGRLVTCETTPKDYERARKLLEKAKLSDVAECRLTSSLDLNIEAPIDLLFSDSSPDFRISEIEHFWPLPSPTSLILVHDVASSDLHKELRNQVLRADKDRKVS